MVRNRKLDPCPICGAKCRLISYGSVECVKHVRKSILVVRKGKQHVVFGESGCPYEVPDLRAHLAICEKISEKPKREVRAMSARKLGKVWLSADSLGMGGKLVDLEAMVERAAIAGRDEMHRQAPGFDWQKIARRILALVEKESKK